MPKRHRLWIAALIVEAALFASCEANPTGPTIGIERPPPPPDTSSTTAGARATKPT